MSKVEKVKKHFRDNKKLYLVGGVSAGVAVATTLVVVKFKGCVPPAEVNQTINQVAVGWGHTQTFVNFVERSTPSKPVHLVGTDRFFASLSEAARATGHSVSDISKNVNGLRPDVKGDVFQLLDKAA